MAEKFIQIYHLIIECNITEARKIQNQVNNIIDMLSSIGFMSAIKETLSMMGICSSKCIEPFPAINEENKEKLLSVLVKNNCMDL